MVLYGTMANSNIVPAGTTKQQAAEHALRAASLKPDIWFDPSVLATCFVESVDVTINNVPVPTNSNLKNYLTQYARFSEIFHHQARNYISTGDDVDLVDNSANPRILSGKKYLDYGTFNATEGRRVPIKLHGIFPFEFTCRPRAALTTHSNDNLFFPPGTCVDIRVNLKQHKDKMIFDATAHQVLGTKYFAETAASAPTALKLTVQDVSLTFETYTLDEHNHLQTLREFHRGMSAKYDYDIVMPMHQTLASNQSYLSNDFQIPPYCSLLCIMFLTDASLFYTPSKNKSTSGFSRFPPNCTKMKLKFNGQSLICDEFENLGVSNNHNELSKKILHDYLVNNRFYNGSFNTYFPKKSSNAALNQCIVVDMENLQSPLVGTLNVETYYNSDKSTAEKQLLVFSIHANARAEVKQLNNTDYNYEWKFFTKP